jgi:hypothetical protein
MGIAASLLKRVRARPAAKPAFFEVPRRVIQIFLLGSICRRRPPWSSIVPSKNVVTKASKEEGSSERGFFAIT